MSSSQAAGNSAAMREALENVQALLVAGVYDGKIDCYAALEIVESALAAPPRNCEKYKTPKERRGAFNAFCDQHECTDCPVRRRGACAFNWLALDADEKPDNCLYCNDATNVIKSPLDHCYLVHCRCGYQSIHVATKDEAVARHNELCRKLKESEKKTIT